MGSIAVSSGGGVNREYLKPHAGVPPIWGGGPGPESAPGKYGALLLMLGDAEVQVLTPPGAGTRRLGW